MEQEIIDSQEQEESAAPEEQGTPVALFNVGPETFALPLEDVAEIVKTEGITALPMAPPFLDGVINLHGNLASVISLAAAMNIESQATEGLLVMLTPERGGFALKVDATTGFSSFSVLEEVTRDTGSLGKDVVFLEGVFRVANKLVSLINPDKLRIWIDGEFAKGDD
jgi:purine-binding chemotaxis protein CheW